MIPVQLVDMSMISKSSTVPYSGVLLETKVSANICEKRKYAIEYFNINRCLNTQMSKVD
jgi:hypothetical protein